MTQQCNILKNQNQEFEQGQIQCSQSLVQQCQRSTDKLVVKQSIPNINKKFNHHFNQNSHCSEHFRNSLFQTRQSTQFKNQGIRDTNRRSGTFDSGHQAPLFGYDPTYANQNNFHTVNYRVASYGNFQSFPRDNLIHNPYNLNKNTNLMNKQIFTSSYQQQDNCTYCMHTDKKFQCHESSLFQGHSIYLDSENFNHSNNQRLKIQENKTQFDESNKYKKYPYGINNKKFIQERNEKMINQWAALKESTSTEIQKHKIYFSEPDWERLLFILHEIILNNNFGVEHLWNFINKFEGRKKMRKGRRVFQILQLLGLQQIFDKLIIEELNFKTKRREKQTKIKTLAFGLVRRIE